LTRRVIRTALGQFTAAAEDGAVTELSVGVLPAKEAELPEDAAVLGRLESQLEEYARGERKTFDLPVRLEGTDFQRLVWAELQKIPYGETRSYGQIASAIGRPTAGRAVGRACGKNRLLLLVPCHRVVGSTGSLTGFSAEGGVKTKLKLLELENHHRRKPE